jgi:glycosyltransferase involved in cell wall biosynthesis
MIAWLVKMGEPTPLDAGVPRLMRTGNLARALADRNHAVVWWTGAFDHQRKRFRKHIESNGPSNPEIRFVKSPGYTKNVSLRRWFDDLVLAWSIYRKMRRADEVPSVIVCSYPLIFTSLAVLLYGRLRGVPVLVDIRDMWPEIFAMIAGGARGVLYRLFALLNRPLALLVVRSADGLIGITDPFLNWGLSLAGRPRSALDDVFPLTSFPVSVSEADSVRARDEWKRLGVTQETRNFCYFGSFTSMVDMTTVVAAAERLAGRNDIRIILCGLGDDFERIKASAEGLETLVLPGWVDAASMRVLMKMSAAGLAPYRDRQDSVSSLSNKVIEYLSFGLPVVAGVGGLLGEMIDSESCGLKYREGDVNGLVDAIVQLADSDHLRARLSRNAKAVYDREFDPSKVYERFARHVERVAGDACSAPDGALLA